MTTVAANSNTAYLFSIINCILNIKLSFREVCFNQSYITGQLQHSLRPNSDPKPGSCPSFPEKTGTKSAWRHLHNSARAQSEAATQGAATRSLTSCDEKRIGQAGERKTTTNRTVLVRHAELSGLNTELTLFSLAGRLGLGSRLPLARGQVPQGPKGGSCARPGEPGAEDSGPRRPVAPGSPEDTQISVTQTTERFSPSSARGPGAATDPLGAPSPVPLCLGRPAGPRQVSGPAAGRRRGTGRPPRRLIGPSHERRQALRGMAAPSRSPGGGATPGKAGTARAALGTPRSAPLPLLPPVPPSQAGAAAHLSAAAAPPLPAAAAPGPPAQRRWVRALRPRGSRRRSARHRLQPARLGRAPPLSRYRPRSQWGAAGGAAEGPGRGSCGGQKRRARPRPGPAAHLRSRLTAPAGGAESSRPPWSRSVRHCGHAGPQAATPASACRRLNNPSRWKEVEEVRKPLSPAVSK